MFLEIRGVVAPHGLRRTHVRNLKGWTVLMLGVNFES